MNKADNNMDKRIEDTLASWDQIERASPGHFFYTRLQARLEKQRASSTANEVFLTPQLQRILIAFLILVFAVNIFTFERLFATQDISNELTAEQALVEEYYPSVPSLYTLDETQIP